MPPIPPLARLGRWSHAHRLSVILGWAVIAVALGFFAPRLESALSGAMWEVNGSDSLAARQIIERDFGGYSSQSAVVVLHSDSLTTQSPAFQEKIAGATALLATRTELSPAVAQPSADGHSVMLQAGTLVDPTTSGTRRGRPRGARGQAG